MKRLLYILTTIISAASVFGCTYVEFPKPLSEFDIIFDAENIVMQAGEVMEIPYTVTGSDGKALDFTPSSGDSKITVRLSKVDYENCQGVIRVIAPKNLLQDLESQVFLTVSDSHGRKLTRFVDIKVMGNGKAPQDDDPDSGDDKKDDDYGDLGIFYDVTAPTMNPGETLDIPFTVTGSEGATLNLEPASDNSDFECSLGRVDYINYQGVIKLTAPDIITEETQVKVTLTASDTHKRSVTKSINVKVAASPVPVITVLGDPSTMAVKAGGSFTLSYQVENLAPAKISGTPDVEATSGWSTAVTVVEDIIKITFTAPSPASEILSYSISAADDHGRSFDYSGSLSIVEITTTAGAANCHIVKPGSTITIKGVKGNSTETLDFDNAVLVWQDTRSMVSSVAGNGNEGVVVVKLADGKQGNAVVAARKGNRIVWSWHLWVTDYDPESNIFAWTDSMGNTYEYMDRNLGAMSAEMYSKESLGLMYQWGRKDPFPGGDDVESSVQVSIYDIDNNPVFMEAKLRPTYDDRTSTNLQVAIENPLTFYYAPSSSWPSVDWLTDQAALQDNDLWGGKTNAKTMYDPCPEGWWIPAAGDGWGFRSEYKKAGKLNDDSKYDETYPWYQDYDKSIGFRYKTPDGKLFWFPLTGNIDCTKGTLQGVGGSALYNTRTDSSNTVLYENMAWGNPASETGLNRPYGASTRCIRE
ncbi:MAG: hypothetical protein MJY91_08570 [Bacteroidales bacterium]|nr:hypothetical protein [Bacteroidales bacterium]